MEGNREIGSPHRTLRAGKDLRDRLRGTHEWLIDSTPPNVSVQFDTDAKVDFILQVAKAEMTV